MKLDTIDIVKLIDDSVIKQYIISDEDRENFETELHVVLVNLNRLVEMIEDEKICLKVGRSTLMHLIIHGIESIIGENEYEE